MKVSQREQVTIAALLERVPVFTPRSGWQEKRACAGVPVGWWYEPGRFAQCASICQACASRPMPDRRDRRGNRVPEP